MLAIRDGCSSHARRHRRRLAGDKADLPLSSVGRRRTRSSAPAEDRRSEIGDRNLISHGPHRHHRRHALRHPARLVFLRAAKVLRAFAAAANGHERARGGPNDNGKCRRRFARAGRGSGLFIRHQHARADHCADEQARALHVHVARRRIETGRTAGLSGDDFRALENSKHTLEQRRGHVEHPRARAGAGGPGRRGFCRRRQFHADKNRRWGSRGEIVHKRSAAREGVSSQLELSGERQRAAGKRVGQTARTAGAGTGGGHGDADGAGRQQLFHVRRRDVV